MIWCRFEREGKVSHGRVVDGEVIEVDGSPIGNPSDTGVSYALGEVRLLGWPPRMSASNVPLTASPLLGQHTQEVLTADLGLADAELAELAEAGVIG